MSKAMENLLAAMKELEIESSLTLAASRRLEEEAKKLLEAVKKLEASLATKPVSLPAPGLLNGALN